MKPVNLLPAEQAVSAEPGKPNLGLIGGAAAVVVALVVVGGYFAFAKVDTIKSETAAEIQAAASAQSETTSIRSQVTSLGEPVKDSDQQLAQGAEQVLIAAYSERYDFVQLTNELTAVMAGTGGWYEKIEATAGESVEGTKSVTITGYMPSKELLAGFNERINGTRSLEDAETSGIESKVLTSIQTKKPGTYWKFTLTASLVDTVAPKVGATSGGGNGDGTTVADGGGSEITLSLDPEPTRATAKKPATPAKPKNPFALASSAAGGGS